MTTDNRTIGWTPEQVEVAAVASINSHRSRAGLPTLATLDGVPNADEWRDDARAALVAAQGAAPVPSSGVDEDKLAELIESIIRENWEMFDDRRHQAQVIARAVAEWLKGQGGESRAER